MGVPSKQLEEIPNTLPLHACYHTVTSYRYYAVFRQCIRSQVVCGRLQSEKQLDNYSSMLQLQEPITQHRGHRETDPTTSSSICQYDYKIMFCGGTAFNSPG